MWRDVLLRKSCAQIAVELGCMMWIWEKRKCADAPACRNAMRDSICTSAHLHICTCYAPLGALGFILLYNAEELKIVQEAD